MLIWLFTQLYWQNKNQDFDLDKNLLLYKTFSRNLKFPSLSILVRIRNQLECQIFSSQFNITINIISKIFSKLTIKFENMKGPSLLVNLIKIFATSLITLILVICRLSTDASS